VNAPARQWAITLFKHSVLKQEKVRQITALVGDSRSKTCLDIGADNGVISYLLRQRGGEWYSADLDARTVESIRQLVGTNVHQIDGKTTPFADGQFDLVVIVDFLEHIHTDREFARELHRILRPGGTLIVNVPHLKPRSVLNRVRHAIGLTDEKHGHVRPGYSINSLRDVLGTDFRVEVMRTYSGSFSEGVDTALNGAYEFMSRRKNAAPSAKGPVITGSDMQRHRKQFLMLRVLYPALWLLTRLDALLFLQPGYKLIIRATAEKHPPMAAARAAADT
jgi:SAM-dependent methyltransferase